MPDVKIEALATRIDGGVSEAEEGQEIKVYVFWGNYGSDGSCWLRVYDLDTGEVYLDVSRYLKTNQFYENEKTITMPNRDLRLKGEAGYSGFKTDEAYWTCKLKTAPPPPTQALLALGGSIPLIFTSLIVGLNEAKVI